MNKATKRNVLASALLSIMLCVSLIAGATYALFTSESKVNVAVTSGKVNVVATADENSVQTKQLNEEYQAGKDHMYEAEATFENGSLTLTKLIPGDGIKFNINIHNDSDVTVQYRTVIEKLTDDGLWDELEVKIDGTEYSGKTKKSEWATLTPNSKDIEVPVEISLPEESEKQGASCTISYTVSAVQGNADVASEWDGETSNPATKNEEDGKYHISTAAEFIDFIDNYMTYAVADGREYVLDRSIDLGGYTIKTTAAQGDRTFDGIGFDGNNHTVSNFTVDSTANPKGYYGGLFGYMAGYNTSYIKNLIVRNATVYGGKQTGAIIGGMNGDNSTVENCKVYDCTIIGTKKVGSVVGYTASGIVKNCYAKDCEVYCAENDASECGEVVGFINTIDTGTVNNTSNNTYENVTVKYGYAFVSSFENLEAAIENGCSHVTLNTGVSNDTPPHTGGDTAYQPYQVKDQYTIEKGQELTIDLNGETYEASVRLFHVLDGGKLTITSSKPGGKITINTTDPDFNYAKNAFGMQVEKGGVLNIEENVTVEMNVTGVANPVALCLNNGTVYMNGGELIVYDSAVFTNNISNFGTFNMNGGKITLESKQTNGTSVGFALWGNGVTANLNAGSIVGKGLAYNKAVVTYFGESNVIVAEGFVIDTTQGPNT